MTKKQAREKIILDSLHKNPKLNTEQVIKMLDISESSTRRLFIEMEKSGKVVRTYGGIHLALPKGPLYSFEALEDRNIAEKKQIAIHAASLICDDDIVYFDSGTTLLQLSFALKQRIENNELQRVRVITNSYANLQVLNSSCVVILCGGKFREHRKDFAGYATERFVRTFLYTKTFLGADGLELSEGFMATDTDTAKLNEVILQRSGENYVLLDSSKIGKKSFVSYASASEVKAIITDNKMNKELKTQYDNAGANVILSDSDKSLENKQTNNMQYS